MNKLSFLLLLTGLIGSRLDLSFSAEAGSPKNEGSGSKDAEDGHAEENPFEIILEEIGTKTMDLPAMDKLLKRLSVDCLNASQVFPLFGIKLNATMSEKQLAATLPLVILKMKDKKPCNESGPTVNATSADLFLSTTVCRSHVSVLIDDLVNSGRFSPNPEAKNCFGPSTILESRCSSEEEEIDEALMKLVASMTRGDCLLPDPSFFLGEIEEFLKKESGKIDAEAFSDLLGKLGLGGNSPVSHEGHDHGDEEEEGGEKEAPKDDKEKKTDSVIVVGKDRDRRSANDEEETTRCYSANEMVAIYGLNASLSMDSFQALCPAIVQQLISGACNKSEKNEHVEKSKSNETYTAAQKYGFGTASVLVISLLAFGGLLLFPNIGSTSYKLVMQFFIALGVGTLSGDALLHLIPEVVGLHGHEEGGGDHAHGGEEEKESQLYIWRILVVVGGIYVFFLFENSLRLWNHLRGSNITFHVHDESDLGHSHGSPSHNHNHGNGGTNHGQHHMTTAITIPNNNCDDCSDDDEKKSPEKKPVRSEKSTAALTHSHGHDSNPQAICCGITPVGIMVLIGDVLHNFGDGIALGVAFSSSWIGGLGASIAIFCHELPHEFGDFAIYLKNGMSKWKALGLNFMAACFAFIGLYIGLSVAENPEVRKWMLAVIAGMFLYIALVDVMHEMIEERTDHPIVQFLVQNFGMCLGWAILLLLALYEDDIKTALA